MIPYGRQQINQQDIDSVCEILNSDYLTQGPAVSRFERIVADYCGVRHAVAVSNATAALHLACLALDLGSGDLAWTSPNTFVASANSVRYCNADVDFIDIDPFNLNLSIDLLTERLAYAESVGRLPKLLVPVHFAGQSCNMKQISILAQKYGLKIIEDASHAIGANYLERAVGSCEYSDCAVFSFHSVKIITTGEGGIVVTNNDDLAARLLILRSHGVTRDASLMQVKNPAPWYYEQLELGYNYRMTDIQAALGASQMTRLNNFVSRRAELASRYNKILSNLPLQLPAQDQDTKSSWHLYVVRLKLNEISCSHQEVFEALRSAGIGVNLHYFPVYLQPYYRSLGFREGHCPEAERYSREAITLPLYPGLSEANQDFIAETLHNILL